MICKLFQKKKIRKGAKGIYLLTYHTDAQ